MTLLNKWDCLAQRSFIIMSILRRLEPPNVTLAASWSLRKDLAWHRVSASCQARCGS